MSVTGVGFKGRHTECRTHIQAMGTVELHICTACGGGHVEIHARRPVGYCRCEEVELGCPDCGATRSGLFDEDDVTRYDRRALLALRV